MQAVPVDDNNDDSSGMPLDDNNHHPDHDSTQRQIFANFAKLRQETNGSTVSERDREQLALETARLIQQEVQRWEASVAELEAAVLQRPQQQPPNNHNANADMIFPTMPAVVDVIDDRSSRDDTPTPPTVPLSALSPVADLDDTEEDDDDDDDDDDDEEMEDDHEEEEEEASTTVQ